MELHRNVSGFIRFGVANAVISTAVFWGLCCGPSFSGSYRMVRLLRQYKIFDSSRVLGAHPLDSDKLLDLHRLALKNAA